VQKPSADDLAAEAVTTSAAVRALVEAARERQQERLHGTVAGCNAEMTPALVRRHVVPDDLGGSLLRTAYEAGRLSARGHYPARLLEAADAPAVLHVAGDADALPQGSAPAVAVVGARRATPYGLEVARALGRGLAAAGLPVVSGMALGIDSAAHAGALEAG